MIKHIIFDLDGVLIDAKNIHYNALNLALECFNKKYKINQDEHFKHYDGLPTLKKLELLTEHKQLPKELYTQIFQEKQKITKNEFKKIQPNHDLIDIFAKIKEQNIIIAVASNSIRETVKTALLQTQLAEYVDFYLSNEDCRHPKPSPEIFLRSMIKANVGPKDTLIVEDSVVGQNAAIAAGCTLCPVKSPSDLTWSYLNTHLNISNNRKKWKCNNLNIVIPMAGAGSRFEKAGYTFPKPLINIHSKPMIQVVVENLDVEGKYNFIVQKEHYERYNLRETLNLISKNCNIIFTEGITEGAACTTLLTKEFINNDNPLLIANSDQFVEWNSTDFLYNMVSSDVDAGIVTFNSTHPKWSFVKIDKNNTVVEVAEKKPISNIATAGIYFWKKGSDYVRYAEQMIHNNIRVNNEFYVCPVFNEAIKDGKQIKIYNINKMWGLGTPEDLNTFLNK